MCVSEKAGKVLFHLCWYLVKLWSGWGLLPLLRSHRKEVASRGEIEEDAEEVELRLGCEVGRLFLLLRPWFGKEISSLDLRYLVSCTVK